MLAPLLRRFMFCLAVSVMLLLLSSSLPVTQAQLANATVQTYQDSACTIPLPAPYGVASSSITANSLIRSCYPATAQLAAQGFSWAAFQCPYIGATNQALSMWMWPASYSSSTACPAINASTRYAYSFNDQSNPAHNATTCVQGTVINLVNDRTAGNNITTIYATFTCFSATSSSSATADGRADMSTVLLAAAVALYVLVAF